MSSKESFISQCVASTPCPLRTCKVVDGACTVCKRTPEETLEWFQMDADERRVLCEELLTR